jgi:pyochelin synthetase
VAETAPAQDGPDVPDLLRDIAARGLSIGVSGTDLRLQGPKERIDAALVGRIRAAKPALIDHLTRQQAEEAGQAAQAAREAEPPGFAPTLLQRSYLIGRGDAVELGDIASHVYHEIEGAWDLDRLEAALRAVVARHGILRTRFTAEGRQVEEPSVDVRIERLDLSGLPEDAQRERLLDLRAQRSHRVLPADRAPLLAAEVTILAPDRMVLHVGHDGLILDGISMFLFFREWHAAYDGAPDAGPGGGEASFEAYIAALETARTRAPAERSRTYWLDRLDDLAPHPDLPVRTSPAAIARTRFTQHTARLDARAWTALKARGAAAGLTPTVLLLAAYAETLSRWGAGDRFTLNSTLANRPPIHPRIFDALGNFSETVLVGIDLDRRLAFRERAAALQARMRRDLDNRHFSGIEVLRELGRRAGNAEARMPFTFNSAIGYVYADLDGSALELFGPEVYTSSQTPQLWLNAFAFEQHGGVIIQVDSVDGLFPEGMIEAMVGGYQSLLDSLLEDAAWSARTFDLLPADQRARRAAANDTAAPQAGRQLQEAFIGQAALTPDAPAVLTSGATMTYGELYRRAADAAAWLRERRVARDELVGLVMTRGPEQIVGIMAVAMAGAAYLPVDAALPEQRIAYMLRDGKVRCVLTNTARQEPDAPGVKVHRLDASSPVDTTAPAPPYMPPLGATPDDLAYVLYTSGTTGEPKGVMVSHRSVANVVADCNARFAVGAGDRFFGISAFNFDLSVYDVFGALSAGAAIVLPDADKAADPAHWLDLCAAAGVTVWNSVPAIVALMRDQAAGADGGAPPALRLVMMSGDRIPPALPALLRELLPGLAVVSLGGPTETTVWNILHPVGAGEDGSESIPYGRPNANNRAYILDAQGLDAPDWVTGEICAAGVGLARGYWGDAQRTAERFFEDPRRGERLYRTGDLGRYLPDGEISILGRGDFQIKVNGYRIEAGEVETRLVAIDAVKQAAVVRRPGAHGDLLVAHLAAAGADRPAHEDVRARLREHLPEYMVPSVVVWHESLPLTRNGKVDRAKLAEAAPEPAAGDGAPGPAGDAAAPTALDLAVAALWASVLRVPESAIEPDGNFYDLGGDSLAAARILTGVRKQFGVGITLDRLYEVQTVRTMAARVAALRAQPARGSAS